jgi:hypothetical protein
MYEDEGMPDVLSSRGWVRWVAALVILALIGGSSYYINGLLQGADPSRSDLEEVSPSDRPADAFACGGTTPVDPIPDDITGADQLKEITTRVEILRELQRKDPIASEYLTGEELVAEVQELNEEGYSPAEIDRDERILRTLGFIEPDDKLSAILDALAGQVAGFYDPRDGRLVVGSEKGASLEPAAELTLAHEIQHALADQSFELPIEEEPDGPDLDRSLAHRSLVEGDATLLQQHYAAALLTAQEAGEILDDPATRKAMQDLADISYPIRRSFEFPYNYGLAFVCDLYSSGGWAAIDAAYRSPPTTTAQVLFPHRYAIDESAEAAPELASPTSDWKLREEASVGAADLLVMFEAPGGKPGARLNDPLGAAAAWAGGFMWSWSRGSDDLIGISLVQRQGDYDLCASMHAWYLKAFPEGSSEPRQGNEALVYEGADRAGVLTCAQDSVAMGIGPDIATARSILETQGVVATN